jgi:hypothetical protein
MWRKQCKMYKYREIVDGHVSYFLGYRLNHAFGRTTYLGCAGFFEVNENGQMNRWEEFKVDKVIVLPLIQATHNIILVTLRQLPRRFESVVTVCIHHLKMFLCKDAPDSSRTIGQKYSKPQMQKRRDTWIKCRRAKYYITLQIALVYRTNS